MKKFLFITLLLVLTVSCSSSDNTSPSKVSNQTSSQPIVIYDIGVSWNATLKGVEITWEKIEGVKEYLIEKSTNDRTYLPVTYVTGITTYVDRNIEQFKTYNYRIKIIKDNNIYTSIPSVPITIPDLKPPVISFTEMPEKVTTSLNADFFFTAYDPGNPDSYITFQCKIDDSNWFPCYSNENFTLNTYGTHSFKVKATDPSGNTTPEPISYTWEITTTIWKMISGGEEFFCGLTFSGNLYCWGSNYYGQLGIGDYDSLYVYKPSLVLHNNWKYVSVGEYFACAINSNKDLYCWGNSSYGELGDGEGSWYTTDNKVSPIKVYEYERSAGNWVDVSAGTRSTCGVKSDGSLWCWGSNYKGMLAIGSWSSSTRYAWPVSVASSNNWKSVYLSKYYASACAIKRNGALWCWGRNENGQLGTGDTISYNYPVQVSSAHWVKIAFFQDSNRGRGTIGLKDDGTIWVWGSSMFLGLTNSTTSYSPTLLSSNKFKDIYGGIDNICAVKSTGELLCWGLNTTQQLGLKDIKISFPTPQTITSIRDWEKVAISSGTICAIKNNGTLYCWGNNQWGGIGSGEEYYNTFQKSDYNIPLSMFSQGNYGYTCAINENGNLLCWGDNEFGELGLGDTLSRSFPQLVTTESGWKYVSSKNSATLAINKDNQLYAWGRNMDYQLGIQGARFAATINTPTFVGNNWKMAKINNDASCGIKLDSTLWCWGTKYLGGHYFTDLKTPVEVTTDTGWKDVAPDQYSKCAIKYDGSLWCWGITNLSDFGTQLNGPVLISKDNWDKIYAYNKNVCGIKFDGSLWCWGKNSEGELGVGDTNSRGHIVQVGNDYNWKTLAMNDGITCGIKYNGELYCWGINDPFHSPPALTPKYVPANHFWKSVQISYSGLYYIRPTICTLDLENHLYCSGSNYSGVMGLLHSPYDYQPHHVQVNNSLTY